MALVMPVRATTGGGTANRPGLTRVDIGRCVGSLTFAAAISIIRLRSLFRPVVSRSKTTTHGTSDGCCCCCCCCWRWAADAGTMTSGGLRFKRPPPRSRPAADAAVPSGFPSDRPSIAARRCAALLARCLGSCARWGASLLGGRHARGASGAWGCETFARRLCCE